MIQIYLLKIYLLKIGSLIKEKYWRNNNKVGCRCGKNDEGKNHDLGYVSGDSTWWSHSGFTVALSELPGDCGNDLFLGSLHLMTCCWSTKNAVESPLSCLLTEHHPAPSPSHRQALVLVMSWTLPAANQNYIRYLWCSSECRHFGAVPTHSASIQ